MNEEVKVLKNKLKNYESIVDVYSTIEYKKIKSLIIVHLILEILVVNIVINEKVYITELLEGKPRIEDYLNKLNVKNTYFKKINIIYI